MSSCRVVIIGGGISGLSAAEYLHRHGFTNITLLEASTRLGGRMKTEQFGANGDEIVEMGANWIHGAAQLNSVITLANQHNLLQGSVLLDRMEGYCYRSDGRVVSPDVVQKVWAAFNRWFTSGRDVVMETGPTTWERHLVSEFRAFLATVPPPERDDVTCVFNCLMRLASFKYAGGVDRARIEGHDSGKGGGIPGGNVKVPLGMRTIIGALVKNVPPAAIKLGQPVNKVDWRTSSVNVITASGDVYPADHVIVTCSIGCLKENHVAMFQPELPAWKSQAISAIPFGVVNKIFLEWEKPFWTRGSGSIKLAWTPEDSTINSPAEWYKQIFAFDEVLNNPHVLVAWISGAGAQHMEGLSDAQILDTCAQLIARFLRNPALPRPASVLVTRWSTDPYVRGSYIYVNREMQEKPGMIGQLGRPVEVAGVPRLLFSGSATIDWAYSTMHGGRSSGLREAERLANHYNILPKSLL